VSLDRHAADAQGARAQLSAALAELGTARATVARQEADLEHERRSTSEKLAVLDTAQRQLADMFSSLSAQALDRNNRAFLELAATSFGRAQVVAQGDLDQRRQAVEHLVGPLSETLRKVETQLQGLEVAREHAYATLTQQVVALGESQDRLRCETASLVTALRTPTVRGRWGELQLRRVVEVAGMVAHCDFDEQVTASGPDGAQRPDMVVHLPGGKHLVVDAKVPLEAYLDAAQARNEGIRATRLGDHARRMRAHVDALAAKAYWAQFDPSPDLVVLFVPGEAFLAAAWEQDPHLFDYAAAKRVLPTSPTTLIALLQSVAYGWREEALAANAREVCETGRELYKRLSTMGEHVAAVGKALDKAVESYNKQVGSLETRVMVSARRLAELEVGDGELSQPEPVERSARALQAHELTLLASVRPGEEVA
jgi:DNA recombination protein RmuC